MINLSRPFIQRPVATVLLTLAIALAGLVAFALLPVSLLPNVEFPVISVEASLSGASPSDMAQSVATPLERRLGVIAGVNEMTSRSRSGSTRIGLQFDLDRDIDSAAREVQAAINAARPDLPATLRSNPSYRKINPAAQPFMILALTSETRTPGQIYDAVSSVVNQRLLQVPGVGGLDLGGASLPAVRVELNPHALSRMGISTEDVRAALQANNANRPKGVLQVGDAQGGQALQILTPPPGLHAADYRDLVIASRGGADVRLADVAEVLDGQEDDRSRGLFNGRPAIIVTITQEPGANLIATADAIDALLPTLRAQLPPDIELSVAIDRTGSIRASVQEVEITLVIAVLLIVLVVGLFLRTLRAALIPAVATVVSLLGTFGAMYLLGYSLNNLTLMALTVATGFVVDDAIVVLENVSRHLEAGQTRMQAALDGAREVGFTVLTMSLSLIAVFIPLLFMQDIAGRLFREFAVTLSVAVALSLLISLTTTPMMCAWLLRPEAGRPPPRSLSQRLRAGLARRLQALQHWAERIYGHSLAWSLSAPWTVLFVLLAVIVLNVYLFAAIPKGFFPEQDNGQLFGGLRTDQSISSRAFGDKLAQVANVVLEDPDVATVVSFTGGAGGGGFMAVALKPAKQRKASTRQVIARLRTPLERIVGLQVFLFPAQDLRMGTRGSGSGSQYVLKSDDQSLLDEWTPRLAEAMRASPLLLDVDDEQNENAFETYIDVDRERARQLGVSTQDLNGALYNAFGQRKVATMYSDMNQYAVIMEWAPEYAQSPAALDDLYVPATLAPEAGSDPPDDGSAADAGQPANPGMRDAATARSLSQGPRQMVPLSSFARLRTRTVATTVSHDGGELSSTLSYELADGVSLEQGRDAIVQATRDIGLPDAVYGSFAGEAASVAQQAAQQLLLVAAAIVVIYIVLGVLYESLIHPITVLTTLPSAGFGAVFALLVLGMDFSLMALIGVFLLIGIVKKNAILIIDFALQAQREQGLGAMDAVYQASLLRFRPILMTTLAAGMGALPLAIGFGVGSELRQPLGVAIVGGLLASQLLTLLTTPVVYVLLDRLRPNSGAPSMAPATMAN